MHLHTYMLLRSSRSARHCALLIPELRSAQFHCPCCCSPSLNSCQNPLGFSNMPKYSLYITDALGAGASVLSFLGLALPSAKTVHEVLSAIKTDHQTSASSQTRSQ